MLSLHKLALHGCWCHYAWSTTRRVDHVLCCAGDWCEAVVTEYIASNCRAGWGPEMARPTCNHRVYAVVGWTTGKVSCCIGQAVTYRLSTCLEMSRNLTADREMWGILLKVREMSGKSCLKLFIVSCIFASIPVFSTSIGMIWVTLKMPQGSAANRHRISHCLEIGHP